MSYTLPAVGTVLPAKENANPTIVNPGPTGNSLAYNEWLQAVVQDQALQQNTNAAQFYQSSLFPGWLANYQTCRLIGPTGIMGDPEAVPTQPPAAHVVLVGEGSPGFPIFDIQPSGQDETGPPIPVCAVPTYAKIPPPNDPSKNKIAQPAVEKHKHHKE